MHKNWRRPCRPAQAEQPEEHLVGQWGQDRGLYTLNYAKRDEREESPEEKKNRGKFDHVTNLLDMLCYAACCVMHARIRDMHKQLQYMIRTRAALQKDYNLVEESLLTTYT